MMTERQTTLIRAALEVLARMEAPAIETVIHAEVNVWLANRSQDRALLTEFDATLGQCEIKRWINGIMPEIGQRKWSITDKGRMALANLQ